MTTQQETKTQDFAFVVQERAIIYARVSTDEQAENGTSIDNQVEKCLAYAQANGLYVPQECIFKEDFTGKVLERPELNRVREILRNGQANHVIVYKTNRLVRGEWASVDLMILQREWQGLDVTFHNVEVGRPVVLKKDNATEKVIQFLEGWRAGEDRIETVKKLHEGRLKRARDGYVVPNGKTAPYGYRKINIDKRWYFEIVEEEAAIIRLIFTWFVLGDENGEILSLMKITARLNEMEVRKRKSLKWTHSMIRNIIVNETYAGVWRYGKRNRNNRTHTADAIPVPVPAIVERDIWEAAQKRLEENKTYAKRNRKPGRYLLSGRITCGECNCSMIGQAKHSRPGSTYLYYRCTTVMNKDRARAKECSSLSFRVDLVDTLVWNRLEEISRDKDKLIEGLRGYQARQENKVEPIKQELGHVEQLIVEKTAEWEDDLQNMRFLSSDMARAKKGADIAKTEKVLDGLKQRKAELVAQLEDKSLSDEQIMSLTAYAGQVADDMATLREAEAEGQNNPELKQAVHEGKRRLLALLNLQVTLFTENGQRKAKIIAKYCPEGEIWPVVSLDTCSTAPTSGLTSRKRWYRA
ncbi:MAG: recombinase family protein [Anaerolineae bacterium]|nr:recombinase family protein [Anaerolineae bacterium]